MARSFDKSVEYDRSRELTPKEKEEAWAGFLTDYGRDNPYSREDDALRKSANTRRTYWERIQDARLTHRKTQTKSSYLKKSTSPLKATPFKSGVFTNKRLRNRWDMEFVLIPAGEFEMGSSSIVEESPKHPVRISNPFYMQVSEVTREQWKAVMGYDPSSHGASDAFFSDSDKLPINNVSWNDCVKFVKKLNSFPDRIGNYRLPTEAEWEYACRAGNDGMYFMGCSPGQLTEYAWMSYNSKGKAHPVGEKNPNPWGLLDIYGNVSEWCQDAYGVFHASLQINPVGFGKSAYRIHRGGNFTSDLGSCRSSYRGYDVPSKSAPWLGFRLALDLKKPAP